MKKRLFLGIEVGETFIETFRDFKLGNDTLPQIRWTKAENLHLTTWFIGTVEEELLGNILGLAQILGNKHKPFELDFQKLALFPKEENARMIWVRYKSNAEFEALIEAHKQLLLPLGLAERAFPKQYPHVTLARFKEGVFNKADFDLDSCNFPPRLSVQRITLWESQLKPSGPAYTHIASYPLSPQSQ